MEEMHLVELVLPSLRPGPPRTFLELGGADGLFLSNTLFLEHCLKFSGLLIEASPTSFRGLEKNRPGAAVVHAAVCERGGRTYVEGGANGADTVSNRRGRRSVEIPCAPLDAIVGELGWRHLAFLSLDVEGSELFVLQATNWSALTVASAVVEERKAELKKNQKVAAFFEQTLGMHRVLTACWKMGRLCDAYYVHPAFVDVGQVLARRDARGLGAREAATEADEHRDRGLYAPNRHRTLHCGRSADIL